MRLIVELDGTTNGQNDYSVQAGDRMFGTCQKCRMLAESAYMSDSGYCADCTTGFDVVDEWHFESIDDLAAHLYNDLPALAGEETKQL